VYHDVEGLCVMNAARAKKRGSSGFSELYIRLKILKPAARTCIPFSSWYSESIKKNTR
jgi:hypothetical protein